MASRDCCIERIVAILSGAAAALFASTAWAEPDACLSMNPTDWPAPAKPYFMLVVDTSGSMTACTTPPSVYPYECDSSKPGYSLNSCGMVPSRLNDAKCALRKTVLAFSGQANFGLATFPSLLSGCPAGACVSLCGAPSGSNCGTDTYVGCGWSPLPGSSGSACGSVPGCLNGPGPPAPNMPEDGWRNGANIVVPVLQDRFWGPPWPSNTAELVKWFDGQCGDSKELFAGGGTPIAGSLQAVAQYLRAGWSVWNKQNYCPPLSFTHPTPLSTEDRPCRSIHVLLVTDGDDTCDGQVAAEDAAQDLFQNGVTLGNMTWPLRTHVINFAGGTKANTDKIAAKGGTGQSLFATSEASLAAALADIIAGAAAPEHCDNIDNNCNGCTDEGYKHYCNVQQTCCFNAGEAQRNACLDAFRASITPNNPAGNVALLPCTSTEAQKDPAAWLCYDPKEKCDDQDNNCQDGADEGVVKCGSPAHCPVPESCNGLDDDCDGAIDEQNVCGTCIPSPEICDGCDNDCDGIADNGPFPSLPCGLPNPPSCLGSLSCAPAVAVPKGTCAPGGGYGACSNSPSAETCDGVDNDCDGAIDDEITPQPCIPPNHPPGLSYGPDSRCKQGVTACIQGAIVCQGGIGPSAELCDGIDNDCDGTIDEDAFGEGQPCGLNQPPCTPGKLACVNGALACQGGNPPAPEVCDGIDNNCNAVVDETPLGDAPPPGQSGCFTVPGTCCTHGGLSWCPPPGATCHDTGSLGPPCHRGTLTCNGTGGWICQGDKLPAAETCDGMDNDCNGTIDDGSLPMVGLPCGSNTGECSEGTVVCAGGILDCAGDIPGTPEMCDGLDNDCDGLIDNGVVTSAACAAPYDTTLYPGAKPSTGACKPGMVECDGHGGLVCIGGIGPSPEVCDGIDNDCDGLIDELSGAGPDSIEGTANPLPPPVAVIGEPCGTTTGQCAAGQWACVDGLFACTGGASPIPEECDCKDNDCDGTADEQGPGPALCSPGKQCVKAGASCQCAEPCSGSEYPCPAGQVCQPVVLSETGADAGKYCVADVSVLCGECATKTVLGPALEAVCAPKGTDPPGCMDTPECICKGPNGCQPPCFNVTCPAGLACTSFGPKAGQCVPDDCVHLGCPGCDKACYQGACVDNPCRPDSCPPAEVCRPSDDFTGYTCAASCTGIECGNPPGSGGGAGAGSGAAGEPQGVWGLPTGGGGCSCQVGLRSNAGLGGGLWVMLAALGLWGRTRVRACKDQAPRTRTPASRVRFHDRASAQILWARKTHTDDLDVTVAAGDLARADELEAT